MSKLNKIIQPESILIEKTALDMACALYEIGRSNGMTSKHKDARSYAHANLEKFIPLAVSTLMDMIANPATPKAQRDAIYDALLERSNDPELSKIGIDAFKNEALFTSDKVVKQEPIILNTKRFDPKDMDKPFKLPPLEKKNG